MYSIVFTVSDSAPRSLIEVEFRRGDAATTRRSVRAKGISDPSVSGTFQWTPAVKAVCVLFASLHLPLLRTPGTEFGKLFGGKGSLASTLDYALAKQPMWLTDMFGVTASGCAVLRLLLDRINPERKLPGPVTVSVKNAKSVAEGISFRSGNRELTKVELQEFVDDIVTPALGRTLPKPTLSSPVRPCPVSAPFEGTGSLLANLPPPFSDSTWQKYLHTIFSREALMGLRSSKYFYSHEPGHSVSSLYSTSGSRRLVSPLLTDLEREQRAISKVARLGISHHGSWRTTLQKHLPDLSVALPVVHIGAHCIMAGLQLKHNVISSLATYFPHSTDLATFVCRAPESRPDLISLNMATGSWFLSQLRKSDYVPAMTLPVFSQRVQRVRCDSTKATSGGIFHLMADIPTSASMYFQDLIERGILDKRTNVVEETDLLDVAEVLSDRASDSRIISPFPFYNLYEVHNVEYLDTPEHSAQFGTRPTMLFVHRRLHENTAAYEALLGLINDTWFELSEGGTLLESTLKNLLLDGEYLRVLSRMAGLTSYSFTTPPTVPTGWRDAA